MAIIVASVFLPYQPMFELDSSDEQAVGVVDSNLIVVKEDSDRAPQVVAEVSCDDQQEPFAISASQSFTNLSALASDPATGAVMNASPPGGLNGRESPFARRNEMSQDSVLNSANSSPLGSPRLDHVVANSHNIDELVAGDDFGVTANHKANHVYSSDKEPRSQGLSPESVLSADSRATENTGNMNNLMSNLTLGRDPTTESLLKGVSTSLLQHKLHSMSQTSLNDLSSLKRPQSPSTASINRVITPKSRAQLSSKASAVVDFAKVKQQQQARNQPTAFRSALPSQRNNVASKLKYSEIPDYNPPPTVDDNHEVRPSIPGGGFHVSDAKESGQYPVSDDDDDDNASADLEFDPEMEYDPSHPYKVPAFGGFSGSARMKATMLKSPQEVFNTLPFRIMRSNKGNGALKNAVDVASFEEVITEPIKWVGTMGIPTDTLSEEVLQRIVSQLNNSYKSSPVITDDETFEGAYKNFCKQILWPTMHYQIPDHPNSKAFEDHSWEYYKKLNQQFADKILETYNNGDTVLINDYHLMLVPSMVRQKLPNAKIGFFLHVSFPSNEVFRCLAQREKILQGMLGANVVQFQAKEYARHFIMTANRLLAADANHDELKYDGNIVSIQYRPVGIDAFDLYNQLATESVIEWRKLIRERWPEKKLIVSRDQFDPLRGIHKKMLAYEKFLIDNPEYIDRVVLIQVCLGRLQNPDLERQIMKVVDRINSMSSNISISQPVVLMHQRLEFNQYMALNAEADMFLITSLREGLNLTSHEFVVCSGEKHAPLLISEFTGSAYLLSEGALLINPWDIQNTSKAIKRGLEMKEFEKRRRWKVMLRTIFQNDSNNWVKSSINIINRAWSRSQERSIVFNLVRDDLYKDYMKTKRHLFILKVSSPPTPKMISILNDLCAKNIVYVMNAFSKLTLENLYGRVLNLGLIAENGAYVRVDGTWYNMVEDVDWEEDVAKILDDKVERLPGSYYKVSDSMIRFHTENADDQERIAGVIGDAITHINTLLDRRGIHAYLHNDVVYVQEAGLSIKAMNFLQRFHTTTTEVVEVSSSGPSRSRKNSIAYTKSGSSQRIIDFICVTGSSSPVIEALFRAVKEQVEEGILKCGHSIVYGLPSSSDAREHVNGLNDLFSVLQHASGLEHIPECD